VREKSSAMAPIKLDMYSITLRRVTKFDMTARLGYQKGEKDRVVEDPRAAHYRNDVRHDQQG